MNREELPAWAIAMGVMSDEDLEQSRQRRRAAMAEGEALERLGRYSPPQRGPAVWTEKKVRRRST